MTNANPFTTMFDLQRTAVKQTQQATLGTLEAQRQVYDAVADSVETYQSLAEQNAEFTKNFWHSYFDAIEASVPEGAVDFAEVRQFVDESVDSTAESQEEVLETLHEALVESGEAFEDYSDNYAEVVEAATESALEANEQLEDSVEAAAESAEEIDVTSA